MSAPDVIDLPPLDGFTRDELCDLVRILHGALVRARADYETLSATAQQAIDLAVTVLDVDAGAA